MISSYNSAEQTLATNGLVSFDSDRIKTGCTVVHTPGSTSFSLTKPGYYYITFNTIVTSTEIGNITIQLRNGTALVPGAVASTSIAKDTDVNTISFATIVRVPPSCCAIDNTAVLSIINSGIAASFTASNINITKLS